MGKNVPTGAVEGYAIGLNKGFYVTKRDARVKPSCTRRGSNRTRLITKLMKTMCGFTAYEKRAMELYKLDDPKLEKRANKFLKKRLGTWARAFRKRDELKAIVRNK